ncbi:MAG: leucine-rich repeat domain-containing protein [Candidatus Methanomethylophilaceae archaeon]|nr:leucine-rich repeat domain-containing protein [Candidatus Methanomethylophilaceae archaeon]
MDVYANSIGRQRVPVIAAVVVLVVIAALILSISDSSDADITTSGKAGDDAEWNYNTSTKTLKISGTGDMWEFSLGSTYGVAGWADLDITRVNISEGITSISKGAFSNHNVSRVQLPSTLKVIGESAFDNTPLSSVKLPSNLKTIGSYAFYNTQISDISLPDSLESIGEAAFAHTEISSLKIPSTLKGFGTMSFMQCKITSITIPGTITSIPDGVFSGNPITYLKLEEGVEKVGANTFSKALIDRLSFPASLKELASYAFSDCPNLVTVTLGEGMKKLNGSVFYNCNNLSEVILGSNITTLDRNLFNGCPSLKYFKLSENISYLVTDRESSGNASTGSSLETIDVDPDNRYFESYDGVLFTKSLGSLVAYPPGRTDATYTIPDAVFSVEDYAFWGTKVRDITIPNTVVSLGRMSIAVDTLVIPDSVASIAEKGISAKHLTIGGGIKSFGASLLYGGSLQTLVIGERVGTINEDLKNLSNLEYIEVSNKNNSYASIGGIVYDKNIRNLVVIPAAMTGDYIMPNTVEYISAESFTHTKFKNVTLSENLKAIGGAAFRNNLNITSIKIPASVISIGGEAFSGCLNLEMVYFECSVVPSMGYHTFYLGSVDNWGSLRVYSTLADGFMDRYAGKFTKIEYFDSEEGEKSLMEKALANPVYIVIIVVVASILLVVGERYISKRRQS